MIVLLTAWLALGLVSAVTGGAVLSLVGWPEQLKHREERFFVSVWVGLFTCASIVLGVASIVPVEKLVSGRPSSIAGGKIRARDSASIDVDVVRVPCDWFDRHGDEQIGVVIRHAL